MALTGFNPEQVKSSITGVNNGYSSMVDAVQTKMQNDFVNKMASLWASQDATEIFAKIKTIVDTELKNIFETYKNIVESMNSAATSWSNTTGNSWTPMTFGGDAAGTIDVSRILTNLSGQVGVDVTEAKSTTTTAFTAIKNAVDSAITSTKTAIASNGFIGGEQSQKLINSLNTISTSIKNDIDTIATEIDTAIKKSAEAYGDLSTKVSQAFDVNSN